MHTGVIQVEYEVGRLLKLINDKLRVKADGDMKVQELTFAQAQVIRILSRNSGQMTQKEIEDFLQVSHPTVVGLVSRLEQKGFLISWLDSADRRNKIVMMTDKAREISDEMDETLRAREEQMLSGLGERQRAELVKLLCKVNDNLS